MSIHSYTRKIACNWKIFWENFNECLHCPGVHPELCDMVPIYGRGIMSEREDPEMGGAQRVMIPASRAASSAAVKAGRSTASLPATPLKG